MTCRTAPARSQNVHTIAYAAFGDDCERQSPGDRWSRLSSGKGLLGALGCAVVLTAANSLVLARATFGGAKPPLRQLVLAAALIATWTGAVEVSVPSPQKTLPYDGFPLAFDDNATLPVLGALGALVAFKVLGLPECQLRPWVFA